LKRDQIRDLSQVYNPEMPHSPSESNSPKDHHELINTSFYDGNGTGMSSALIPILDVHKGRPVRLQVKVMVPVQDHPNVSLILTPMFSFDSKLKVQFELIVLRTKSYRLSLV